MPETADGLVAAALRAEAWAGEPFLRADEDPAVVLAPGTARRRALDEALAEIEAGRRALVRLEGSVRAHAGARARAQPDPAPHLASGTELRRHQIDALAGMLTELIAANERWPEANGNGNGATARRGRGDEDDDEDDEVPTGRRRGGGRRGRPSSRRRGPGRGAPLPLPPPDGVREDDRRRRLRRGGPHARRPHPHPPPPARLAVPARAHGGGLRRPPRHRRSRTAGAPTANPVTIQTYAWFARHVGDLNREAYHLVIADEAHTALGEKTSAAIRSFPEPIYIGMTATEQLIAKQVSDVFPASVDDLPLADAARRGLIAPLRSLRVPPAAAIHSVPIVGGDFDEGALAAVLDHQALNQAAASLYRDRFDNTPGIVYAAGVEHAYNLAQEFRAAGLKAEAVSGRTPPVRLAETLAAYERGEINVLINAMLLAEGWNSPRATVCMHLAPTASRRVYQQRIGRIMRMHPRKEAGIVVDFVPKSATHNERVVSLHSLLDSDFYREGARVTPAPRRRQQRRARRKLTPAPWLVPVTPDVRRRLAVITREWQRVDPKYLDEDEQRYWATIAGAPGPLRGARRVRQEAHRRARLASLSRAVPRHVRGREPEPAPAHDRARRPRLDDRRARRLRRPRHARDAGADLGEGPPAGGPDPAARDRRGTRERARADPGALDVAARPRDPQGAGPPRERGVPRGQAPARRARELPRPPARGERGAARRRGAGAAAAGRRRAARVGRGLHAARDASCSTRHASRSRRCPRWPSPSPRTCPRRSRRPSDPAGAGARRRGPQAAGAGGVAQPGENGAQPVARGRRADAAQASAPQASARTKRRPTRRPTSSRSPPTAEQ